MDSEPWNTMEPRTLWTPKDPDFVIILVGSDPHTGVFRRNKAKLCQKVPYFNNMFNGHFAEAADGIGEFPKDNPRTFELLLRWVDDGCKPLRSDFKLPEINRNPNESIPKSERTVRNAFDWDVVDLLILAKKLRLTGLMEIIEHDIKHNLYKIAGRKDWYCGLELGGIDWDDEDRFLSPRYIKDLWQFPGLREVLSRCAAALFFDPSSDSRYWVEVEHLYLQETLGAEILLAALFMGQKMFIYPSRGIQKAAPGM